MVELARTALEPNADASFVTLVAAAKGQLLGAHASLLNIFKY
jgi:hypothetical protein